MAKSLKLPSIPTSGNERFVASRRVQLCHVMEGEIIHDIEFLLNLHNSLFRVFCSTECEFYSLDTKQIDRFPLSRKSYVLKLLKTRTETRLSSRVSTIPGGKFDILPLLILQLRFVRILKENKEESARIHRLPLSAVGTSSRNTIRSKKQQKKWKLHMMYPRYPSMFWRGRITTENWSGSDNRSTKKSGEDIRIR